MKLPIKAILLALALAGIAVAASAILKGCASTIPNREPLGERFPSVQGQSLDGRRVAIPEDFAGRPILLLVGTLQETQFDIDRWLLGLLQSGTDLPVREVPTIADFIPGLFQETIDSGMREGIPEPDWGAVITVYEDGDRIVEFLGNESPRNARAILLDAQGKVVKVHAEGYSPRVLLEFLEAAKALR